MMELKVFLLLLCLQSVQSFKFPVATVKSQENSCERSGCLDCYSWCSMGKINCKYLHSICRKTCNECHDDNEDLLEWIKQGECSKTCGKGQQTFVKYCKGSKSCNGKKYKFEDCNNIPCSTWSEFVFGECSVSCGKGIRTGKRICLLGKGSDVACNGSSTVNKTCNEQNCEVSSLEKSETLTKCSKSCGGGYQACNEFPCPQWGAWEPLGECSRSCGNGKQKMKRICINGRSGDNGCQGPQIKYENCNKDLCSSWTQWSLFSSCSSSCGDDGVKVSFRYCSGKGCQGSNKRSKNCNRKSCPSWTEWKSSECSRTCGGGFLNKTRQCLNGIVGNKGCQGLDSEVVACNLNSCSYWSNWNIVGSCSVTCGKGLLERKRVCLYGDECKGPSRETTECVLGRCSDICRYYSDGNLIPCSMLAKLNMCATNYSLMGKFCSKTCCKLLEDKNKTCKDKAGSRRCSYFRNLCYNFAVASKCKNTCKLC